MTKETDSSGMAEKPYHRFIFDAGNRRFLGRFEEMYRAEDTEHFSSWNQDDLTHPTKRLALAILEPYNFRKVVDCGCGKGAFTHLLKRPGGDVLGLDVSETAVSKASVSYPSVRFRVHDFVKEPWLPEEAELAVAIELLSYLPTWRELLKSIGGKVTYFLSSLYLPPNPIGFVKSHGELLDEVSRYFELERKILIDDRTLLIMAKSSQKQ